MSATEAVPSFLLRSCLKLPCFSVRIWPGGILVFFPKNKNNSLLSPCFPQWNYLRYPCFCWGQVRLSTGIHVSSEKMLLESIFIQKKCLLNPSFFIGKMSLESMFFIEKMSLKSMFLQRKISLESTFFQRKLFLESMFLQKKCPLNQCFL